MKWFDVLPLEAINIDCTTRPDLDPPVNEEGEVCAWPWMPEWLVGVPIGQFHCGFCGAMVVAGVRHPDYRDMPEPPHEDGLIEDWPPRTPPGGIENIRVEG